MRVPLWTPAEAWLRAQTGRWMSWSSRYCRCRCLHWYCCTAKLSDWVFAKTRALWEFLAADLVLYSLANTL